MNNSPNSSVVEALFKILAKEVQTSGNLENRLRGMETEAVIELSDAHITKTGLKTWEAFEVGLDLGRDVREKTVYRVDINDDHFFFVGTEADIIRKIEEGSDGEITPEDEETIDLLEQEIRSA